jgi:hypothetical protein
VPALGWAANGVALCTAASSQYYQQIAQDGQGGAIIAWQDYRSGGTADIYAQRVINGGTLPWTTASVGGVAVCAAVSDQESPQLIPDGQGGAIITWQDYRSGTDYDIYAQRVGGATGAAIWPTVDGVAVCTSTYSQQYPQLVPDGRGGAIIAWQDSRSGTNDDIYAQRINGAGVGQWTANGIGVCTYEQSQNSPQLVPDGDGGAIITWFDYRSSTSSNDIYAQRLNSAGAVQWAAAGLGVCTAANNQFYPQIVLDGQGGAIIAWFDDRGDRDIYAHRIALTQSTIEINEIMFDQASGIDWVEIHNPTLIPYDITGWTLKDDSGTIYTFPATTTLVAGAYSVTTVSGLSSIDDVTLTDLDGAIRDFVAWGTSAPSDANYDAAVASENWYAGQYIYTTSFALGNTLGRDRISTDTNSVSDWEITCGINADAPTPIAVNDTPEFPTVAIPIFLCAIPFIVFRAKRRKPNGGE